MDLNVNHFLYEVSRNLEQSRLVFEQFNTRSRIISPDEWLVIKRKVFATFITFMLKFLKVHKFAQPFVILKF